MNPQQVPIFQSQDSNQYNQPISQQAVTNTNTTTSSNVANANPTGTKSRFGLFGKKKRAQSTSYGNNNNANTNTYPQTVNVNPIGVGDVTHHSYRWAHRDKNLVTSDNYGGAPPRKSKQNRKSRNNLNGQQQLSQTQSTTTTNQVLTGYPQQTFQTTIIEEVPMNNIPANNIPVTQKKRSHPFQTFFGRKHHDSGGNVGMLGSGPTGGLGLPSRANVVA